MNIVLATSNKGKVKEIANAMVDWHILNYTDFIAPQEIEEHGTTFAENSIIKATEIAAKLPYEIILADDSGISVPALNNEPGLFSARYAGKNATDKENLEKLCSELKKRSIKKTKAYYTAAITVVFNKQIITTHGFCYGEVLDEPRGENGFGYDPIFIPTGYTTTFGEMDDKHKLELSHRTKGLQLMEIALRPILRG
ncbi:MAG: non-canonical purine pyrophosphatase, RdgB/HAM1 family [Pseudomonadota bacterium]|jgi:XTP/dITP diphosphohydrolase